MGNAEHNRKDHEVLAGRKPAMHKLPADSKQPVEEKVPGSWRLPLQKKNPKKQKKQNTD